MEWKDVTECFSESQRHYKDTYLELDEVYNDELYNMKDKYDIF